MAEGRAERPSPSAGQIKCVIARPDPNFFTQEEPFRIISRATATPLRVRPLCWRNIHGPFSLIHTRSRAGLDIAGEFPTEELDGQPLHQVDSRERGVKTS